MRVQSTLCLQGLANPSRQLIHSLCSHSCLRNGNSSNCSCSGSDSNSSNNCSCSPTVDKGWSPDVLETPVLAEESQQALERSKLLRTIPAIIQLADPGRTIKTIALQSAIPQYKEKRGKNTSRGSNSHIASSSITNQALEWYILPT